MFIELRQLSSKSVCRTANQLRNLDSFISSSMPSSLWNFQLSDSWKIVWKAMLNSKQLTSISTLALWGAELMLGIKSFFTFLRAGECIRMSRLAVKVSGNKNLLCRSTGDLWFIKRENGNPLQMMIPAWWLRMTPLQLKPRCSEAGCETVTTQHDPSIRSILQFRLLLTSNVSVKLFEILRGWTMKVL